MYCGLYCRSECSNALQFGTVLPSNWCIRILLMNFLICTARFYGLNTKIECIHHVKTRGRIKKKGRLYVYINIKDAGENCSSHYSLFL